MKTLKYVMIAFFAALVVSGQPHEPVQAQAKQPAGEKTADGIRYKLSPTAPANHGDGYAIFSRDNGYLRVDMEARWPNDVGDGNTYGGTAFEIALSVDGKQGRRLMSFPNRVWNPDPILPTIRYEYQYELKKETVRVTDLPCYAVTGNGKFWDRVQATMWINLAKINITGNSATNVSDSWKAAIYIGNYRGNTKFPDGMDIDPSKTPDTMLNFKLSELPERPKTSNDPWIAGITRERTFLADLARANEPLKTRRYKDAFEIFKTLAKAYPDSILIRYNLCIFADNLQHVFNEDPLPYIKDYIDSCPSNLPVSLRYIHLLFVAGRDDDAMAYYNSIMATPVGSDPLRKATLDVDWLKELIDNGYSAKVEPLVQPLIELKEVQDDPILRVMAKTLRAILQEAKGDSKAAATSYDSILKDEGDAFAKTDRGRFTSGMRDYHNMVAGQWDLELKWQAEEAKKKAPNPRLEVETTKGKFTIDLFEDEAPNSIASVVSLAQAKYYDNTQFYRYEPGYMIQGGDPKGDGAGPGYNVQAELNRRNFYRGVVGLLQRDPKIYDGGQFYVCKSNSAATLSLSSKCVAIGRVVTGMEVVDKLRKGDKITKVTPLNLREHKYEPKKAP